MQDYEIEFTRLARAIIKARYNEDAIEELVRGTVEKLHQEHDIQTLSELGLFVISPDMDVMDSDEAPEDLSKSTKTFLLCRPKSDTVLHVDTCSFQPMGKMESGPHAGKEVMMPVGDSDDREDDDNE